MTTTWTKGHIDLNILAGFFNDTGILAHPLSVITPSNIQGTRVINNLVVDVNSQLSRIYQHLQNEEPYFGLGIVLVKAVEGQDIKSHCFPTSDNEQPSEYASDLLNLNPNVVGACVFDHQNGNRIVCNPRITLSAKELIYIVVVSIGKSHYFDTYTSEFHN